MYLPKRFQETDRGRIERFMQQNSFAVLVSVEGGTPVATHLPLELETGAADEKYLRGHLARANSQWRTLQPEAEALAIFTGPHAYISPRWYHQLNVPTWNYIAVHAYGRLRVIEAGEELYALLKRQVDKYESGHAAERPYRLEHLPPDFVAREMRGVVGVEMRITRLEAKFKLSQNREQQDYDSVIVELEKTQEQNARAVAAAMREQRPAWR